MRARILRPIVAAMILMALAVPAVSARPPTSGPPTSEFDWTAGDTCAFAVRSEDWSNLRERTRGSVTIYTGPATSRLTNLDHPDQPSVTVRTGGMARIESLTDGTRRITAKGTTLFYFFPGDVTPDGGDDGGWYLIHGLVRETLSADNFITSLSIQGSYRDLCAEIAG